MSLKKKPAKPPVNQKVLNESVQGASDSKEEKPAPTDEDRLVQISITINKSDLDRVDAAAKKQRISRSAFFRQSVVAAIPD